MPNLPLTVQPGDIISSELMTLILNRLAELTDVVLTGTQMVPDVVGMRLFDAKNLIQQPSRQLSLGFVIDLGGASLNPNSAENAALIVINQSPTSGSLAQINAPVNLIVSQSAQVTPSPGPQPTIAGTETLDGTSETDFAVNDTLVIVGTNFSANAAQNFVTFNDTRATQVSGDPADPTRRLFVTVPTGIPGAPVNPGDGPLSNVVVRVRNVISNLSAMTSINVTAPVGNAPSIVAIEPSIQFEGEDISITGANFSPDSQVTIRDVSAVIVSTSASEIVATVPQFNDIASGALVPAKLVVTIPGVGSAAFAGTFRVRGV